MQSYESQKCLLSETNSAQGDQETHKAAHQRHGQSSTPEDRSYLMDKTMCDGRRNIYDSESENRLTKRSYLLEVERTTKRQIRQNLGEHQVSLTTKNKILLRYPLPDSNTEFAKTSTMKTSRGYAWQYTWGCLNRHRPRGWKWIWSCIISCDLYKK